MRFQAKKRHTFAPAVFFGGLRVQVLAHAFVGRIPVFQWAIPRRVIAIDQQIAGVVTVDAADDLLFLHHENGVGRAVVVNTFAHAVVVKAFHEVGPCFGCEFIASCKARHGVCSRKKKATSSGGMDWCPDGRGGGWWPVLISGISLPRRRFPFSGQGISLLIHHL